MSARFVPPVSPTPADLEAASRGFVEVVAGLHGLLRQLVDLAGEKLVAMRRADAGELNRCTAVEHDLLERVQHNRLQRNAVLARLAQSLHWPGVKSARLAEIAARIPEPFSSAIRARIAGLQALAAVLEEKNRLAARVAHDLHYHVRSIFADLAKAAQETVVYGPNGNPKHSSTRAWVDAVG